LEVEYKLKLEQMTRDVKDAANRDGDMIKELEVAKANHKRLREDLDEYLQRVNTTREDLSKVEQSYITEKAERTRLYIEARAD